MSGRSRGKRASAVKGQGSQPPKRNPVRGGVVGPSGKRKKSNVALAGDRARRPVRAATAVSADSDVSTLQDVRPSAPSTELPLATSRPFRAGAVQKTQQVRSSPGSRAADDRLAPSGKVQPRRMTRSSAAATGIAQQANPAPLTGRASSKARVAKTAATATTAASSTVPSAAPSPRTSSRPTQKHPGYYAEMVNQSPSRAPRPASCIPRMPGFTSFSSDVDSEGGGNTPSVEGTGSAPAALDKAGEGRRQSVSRGTREDPESTQKGKRKAKAQKEADQSQPARKKSRKDKRESIKYEGFEKMVILEVLMGVGKEIWTLKFVGAKDATEKVWEERVQVPVIATLEESNADYYKGLATDETSEADVLKERFSVERLRAWFDSTKAQEAKARINEKNKTGAAGRRPPTTFQTMRATFFGNNAAVCKPDLVREVHRSSATYSPESARRLGGNEQLATGATRKVTFSSDTRAGNGGGSAGASAGSTSAPSASDVGASSTPVDLSKAGGSVSGVDNSSRSKGKGKARAAPSALTGPAVNPVADAGPPEVTSIFDGSGEEDNYRMEEDTEISPEVAAMEDECPPHIGDPSGDFPENAEDDEPTERPRRRSQSFKPQEFYQGLNKANAEKAKKEEKILGMMDSSQQLLAGLAGGRSSSSGARAEPDKDTKIARAQKRLDMMQSLRAIGNERFSEEDVMAQMVKIALMCE